MNASVFKLFVFLFLCFSFEIIMTMHDNLKLQVKETCILSMYFYFPAMSLL